ncbi:MAG: polyphosphate kinase 2 [Devosiaceae bacterium]|nr:polyphosphate kinase 2 [Devosiaceae bacterium MH13]
MTDLPKPVADAVAAFDLDDPVLPAAIDDYQMLDGGYPYDKRLKRSRYEERLEALQIELVKLQSHLQAKERRLVVVFEGRDAAGKGGSIFNYSRYLNKRHTHVAALSKPTETERGQWYFQRYTAHLPTQGDTTLFDRSWYNRAGVEPVMGFCTPEQHERFLGETPAFEKALVRDGIVLVKFWLNIGRTTQIKRFHDRRHSPLKIWKLSPIDLKALGKWDDYTRARDVMLERTHTEAAPWTIVRMNDKRRGRLEIIRHVLTQFDYEGRDDAVLGDADPAIIGLKPEELASA